MHMQVYNYQAGATCGVGGGGGFLGLSLCPATGFGSEGRTGGERAAAAAASVCNGCGEPAGVAMAAPWFGSGLGWVPGSAAGAGGGIEARPSWVSGPELKGRRGNGCRERGDERQCASSKPKGKA